MKGLLCTLLLLETFVFVVQQQVDGGLAENEISQQLSTEDRRQNPAQTDPRRDESDSQQYCHLSFSDIHAALRELTATVTEQKANIRALETQLKDTAEQQTVILEELNKKNDALETRLRDSEKTAEQQTVILEELNKKNDALETRLRDSEKTAEQQMVILEELNKKTDEMSNLTESQVEELRKENRDREIAFSAGLMESGGGNFGPFTTEITLTYRNVFTNIGNAYNPITGIFTAPLKGAYMFNFSIFGSASSSTSATVSIVKNGEKVVIAHGDRDQHAVNSSKGVVLILEVGDVVYVRLWSGRWIYDDQNKHNTFSGYLLFPLREQELCRM
uniref:C1q domain-containing protein n=1 Tax=Cyprinus carpio TaxID=7962 RepID=A0A8C1VTU3_CYPCA